MDHSTAISQGFDRPPGGAAAGAALAIFALSLGTLLGAWYFQYVLGYPPCPLCLQQRIPYYMVIPLSLVLTGAARWEAPRWLLAAGLAVILIAALCSTAFGAYHAGIEWRFWPGPTDCTGPLADLNTGGSLLDQLNSVRVVRCDQAAWRFVGISLAGYNALISLAMAAIAGYALLARKV